MLERERERERGSIWSKQTPPHPSNWWDWKFSLVWSCFALLIRKGSHEPICRHFSLPHHRSPTGKRWLWLPWTLTSWLTRSILPSVSQLSKLRAFTQLVCLFLLSILLTSWFDIFCVWKRFQYLRNVFIVFLDVKVLPKFWGPVFCDGLENLVGFSKGLSSSYLLPRYCLPDESCQGLSLKYY
jgi:hypothetical protein